MPEHVWAVVTLDHRDEPDGVWLFSSEREADEWAWECGRSTYSMPTNVPRVRSRPGSTGG